MRCKKSCKAKPRPAVIWSFGNVNEAIARPSSGKSAEVVIVTVISVTVFMTSFGTCTMTGDSLGSAAAVSVMVGAVLAGDGVALGFTDGAGVGDGVAAGGGVFVL